MEAIHEWLLHNTGNAGNHYTILNIQRDESNGLDVMARTSDFKVVNLSMRNDQNSVADSADNDQMEVYHFKNEQQVIDFLANGQMPPGQWSGNENSIVVSMVEPDGEAGDITFPPTQV